MATYEITTSAEMEVALQYDLENVNAARVAAGDNVLTAEELLQARNDSDLANVLRNLDSVLSVALSNLTALQSNQTVFDAVMDTIESQAMKDRILQLLP